MYLDALQRSGNHGSRTFKAVLAAGVLACWSAAQAQSYYPVKELLSTGKTVVGEDIRYPTSGAPRITVSIVTVAPGSDASFHRHPVPLVAYILEGELTVDYGPKGTRVYRQGDALVEAMDQSHRGFNPGTSLVRLLAVYIGAEGTDNVALDKK
jgi:quercetin dioxygenase-like cupin family protein